MDIFPLVSLQRSIINPTSSASIFPTVSFLRLMNAVTAAFCSGISNSLMTKSVVWMVPGQREESFQQIGFHKIYENICIADNNLFHRYTNIALSNTSVTGMFKRVAAFDTLIRLFEYASYTSDMNRLGVSSSILLSSTYLLKEGLVFFRI